MPITLTDQTFDKTIQDSQGLLMVDFWAPWCGPCKMLGPIVDELALEFKDKFTIGKVNVDENSASAEKFGVMSIPTLIFFQKGKAVKTMIGLQSKDNLKASIDQLLKV